MAGRDGQVVYPPAVPIETDHHGSHQFSTDRAHKKQLGLFGELACNVSARIVPRAGKTALLPQRDNRPFIDWLENSDLHMADDAQRSPLDACCLRHVALDGAVGWQGMTVISRQASNRCALRYEQACADRFPRRREMRRPYRATQGGRGSCGI